LQAITTKILHNVTAPMLLKLIQAGRLDPKKLITHEFGLSEAEKAYKIFGAAAKNKALKVVLNAE
jgi:alcohol dehydrogenase